MNDLIYSAELLKENDNYNILIHAFPDGDAIGSGFSLCRALRSIGKRANVVCSSPIPNMYSYITGDYVEQEFEPKTFVAVDVADLRLLGEGHEKYAEKVLLSLDHHGTNLRFAKYSFIDPHASSACEIVLEVIKVLGVQIDKRIAECIYTGISTDTGCFRYSNTTAQTLRTAADLVDIGIDSAEINRIMFETKSRSRIEIERLALESMTFHYDDRVAFITITKEMRQKAGVADGELEGITSLPRQIEGVKIGITLRQKDDGEYKISVRTHPPYDAAEICSHFGGGGHVGAAGCTLIGDIDEIKNKMLVVCEKALVIGK